MPDVAHQSSEPDSAQVDAAVLLAAELQERAAALQTPQERRQQAELDRMLQTPDDKVILVQLTDQAFRSATDARTAEHLTHLLDVQGVPRFFSPLDRALLRGFRTFGGFLPGVAVPLVKGHMQRETANVVLPAEHDLLAQHLQARQRVGVRMNLNLLGESLLGEGEALRRLERNLEALQWPEVEVVSVKISTLYSQISTLARARTLHVLCERLELLYRQAAHLRYTRADGSQVPKFVYLDMEEYRDLRLTAEAFMRTLDRPGLEGVSAGIALQAYLPDSTAVQEEITTWARKRVAAGGAPVTIRLVKGANLEAERVEAALRGWPQAPYQAKRETDAHFKRMLHHAFRPGNLAAVRLGVASHNLFDVAYAMVLAAAAGAGDRVQFEMLEGMANPQRRAVFEKQSNLLLYAPACLKSDFLHAIGYLIRRLDENTGPDNFLRYAFRLRVGSSEWRELEQGFRGSFAAEVCVAPRRIQNRLTDPWNPTPSGCGGADFRNEPDTDWSLPANVTWAEGLLARAEAGIQELPLVIGGEARSMGDAGRAPAACLDPSRPGVILAHYAEADGEDISQAVGMATADRDRWRHRSPGERDEILGRAAAELRRSRGLLMWAALANGGKTLTESDPEVSEAVDFVEFYRQSARGFAEREDESWAVRLKGRGVVVVVSPWNFPIAIPCGGVAAALAAGNSVILKPASATVLVAWELCQCFWRAGVPPTALQLLPCTGADAQKLATHPGVDTVILTGGTATALHLLRARPTLRLFAETGGKNATIVTAMSDRELAIRHVVHSAFSHSGQKCSATSLLLLEDEVYDDEGFKRGLADAVASLPVGSAWDPATRVGPLIRPPAGDLERALKTLEPGESWAVHPRQMGDNPQLWSPGVKYGVQPGNFTHRTELFGPVLGVMRFRRLDEAIALVNQTGYGLTSGLESLDEREHRLWRDRILAGNLYINRGTTGAVVYRQPFGGLGRSSVGSGLKAGGPNYVAQFMALDSESADIRSKACPAGQTREANAVATSGTASPRRRHEILDSEDATPSKMGHGQVMGLAMTLRTNRGSLSDAEHSRILGALESYSRWWRDEFAREHDAFCLLGQDNLRRYLPFGEIRVRVVPADTSFEMIARVGAARMTGARVLLSCAPQAGLSTRGDTVSSGLAVVGWLESLTEDWAGSMEILEESDEDLADGIAALQTHSTERVRYAAPDRVPAVVRKAAAKAGIYLADEPVLTDGRLELLWYLREQSISSDYHRYGNLGRRAGEPRKGPE